MIAGETTLQEDTVFTEKGQCKDEVKLIFDDNKELYVSENFLSLSSPVFKAMFENDFVEKKEMTVKLAGKNYDDFLEFFMCIHPAVLKSVDERNVIRIVPIAEEYQVISISCKCKKLMKKIINRDLKVVEGLGFSDLSSQAVLARKCLIFLSTAVIFNFDDVVDCIIDALSRCPSLLYSGFDYRNKGYINYKTCCANDRINSNEQCFIFKDLQTECVDLFAKLPAEIRLRVNSKRLHILDSQKFV